MNVVYQHLSGAGVALSAAGLHATGTEACPVKAGDLAPDFELFDRAGFPRRLSSLLEKGPVVLFFYPAALSAGGTKETCRFRDLAAEFVEVGALRVAVSGDPIGKQRQFDSENRLGYVLLSDADGAVATDYGVRRRITALGPRRVTFVISPQRRIMAVIHSETRMAQHADRALAVLRAARGWGG